jgi:hypothetical protein
MQTQNNPDEIRFQPCGKRHVPHYRKACPDCAAVLKAANDRIREALQRRPN